MANPTPYDPRNEDSYDTWDVGMEPIPGDQTWKSTPLPHDETWQHPGTVSGCVRPGDEDVA